MDWIRESEGWISRDKVYLLVEEENPWWTPGDPEERRRTWHVRAGVERRIIDSAATLEAAQTLAERDSTLPIFTEWGACRWCHTEEDYLRQAPKGWFGCGLCSFLEGGER